MKYHPLAALAGAFLLSLSAIAQNRTSSDVSPSFRGDVQKVVADFAHGFSSIRGRQLDHDPQTIEYASLVRPEGSKETSITQYSAHGKPVYSWQTVLLRTEDYADAAKKYKWAFGELKGMNVRYVVDQYTLEGKLDKPDESRNFASSELRLAHPPEPLRKLKVRVQLQYEMPEWKVSIMVFEQEKEDDEMAEHMD
ncbi:hypothetical protein [Flaviaesturariibacter amylovorans]|uniref:Uncharacterized protein n=1 Tax=Flaviaesturariibacter amylovorans TaxID=1084520 RepID=A0ABP8HG17_9BACT